MDDLAQFLTERYAEAEAKARACEAPSPWKAAENEHDSWIVTDASGGPVIYDEGTPTLSEAEFIADNDPAHRLADIALKRAILAGHEAECNGGFAGSGFAEGLEFAVRQLGTEFAEHPAYKPEWRPE